MSAPFSRLSALAREVVAQRLAIVAAVTAVLHTVIALHWLTIAQSDGAIRDITGALDLLGVIVGAAYVRSGVTPLSDPRDNTGTPLAPIAAPAAAPLPAPSDAELAAASSEPVRHSDEASPPATTHLTQTQAPAHRARRHESEG